MTIILPILLFAVGVGLFVKQMTPRVWFVMIIWIMLVIAWNYFKH